MKRSILALIPPMCLLLAGPAAARPAPPPKAAADARVAALEAKVAELARLVAEQGRRLTALEQRLAPTQLAPAEGDAPQAADHGSPEPPEPPELRSSEPRPWTVAANWAKLHLGMSEEDVVAILGPPDATREIGFSRTLVYRGEVPGAGAVRGTVRLKDGKVSEVAPPDL